jgi:anti-anti-sigma factor
MIGRDVSGDQPFSNLSIASRPGDDRLHAVVAGDIDMAVTFRLEPEIDRLLNQPGVRELVLDLGGVGFIDSAGLGALLSIRERAASLGVRMRVTNVRPRVQRMLEVRLSPTAGSTRIL